VGKHERLAANARTYQVTGPKPAANDQSIDRVGAPGSAVAVGCPGHDAGGKIPLGSLAWSGNRYNDDGPRRRTCHRDPSSFWCDRPL